jgi:SAM-dependent methyltransferase
MRDNDRRTIQESLYEFPYHHIPRIASDGTPTLIRRLSWGLEYLCYQRHLHEKVISMNPKSVLEIGCGDGYFIGNLPPSINIRVGMDLSSQAIAFARIFHPDCIFYDQDARAIEDRFDVVAAIEVIEHIPDDKLREMYETLYERVSDDGRIIVSVPTTVMPLNEKHYRHYTLDLLETQLRQSGARLRVAEREYIFSRPWWYGAFQRFSGNRLFTLEVKPLMRFAWRRIWRAHRIADENTGYHIVATLEKAGK